MTASAFAALKRLNDAGAMAAPGVCPDPKHRQLIGFPIQTPAHFLPDGLEGRVDEQVRRRVGALFPLTRAARRF
ncbi:hypothetical protein ACFOM8_13720 [Paracoccus angustae]|uniref:Uncharacterized protein n=1 Tax=Paracoccus angustae TaxID=1671480 RepID=A0ABV7U6D2_9RHOB